MLNSSHINSYERSSPLTINIQALIGITGIVCNILAICVFERKQLKKYSYSTYWKAIAFFDSFLLLHTFRNWSRYFLQADIDLISPYFCSLVEYHGYVVGGISLLLESIITFDRYFTIVYRNRFKLVKQRSFQIGIISLAILYSLIHPMRLALNYRLDRINDSLICHVPIDILNFTLFIVLINIITVNIVINPILDLKIISHIYSTRGNSNRNRNGNNVSVRLNRSTIFDRKFAISAITLNINSLIYKLLFILASFLSGYLSPYQADVFYSFCLSIALVEKADIFIINMLVNSIFRQEFLSLIGLSHKNNSTNHHTSNRSLAVESIKLLSSTNQSNRQNEGSKIIRDNEGSKV